jgi:Fe-S-cluster containining protein
VVLAKNAMAAMSKLSAGLLARAPEGSVACRSGCDHCCYQSVGVTAPEALAIFDHLRATRSKDELAAVREHVTQSYERTRNLSTLERFSPDHPCPFLAVESGQCTIYEVRPLSCRGMNSLDATECSTRLRDPDARAEFLKVGFGGHSYMEPIRAFHAISAGLQLGLSEIYRLDMRPLDLTAALHLLLNGDEAISREWLEGRRAFEAARGGDSSASLGGQELSGILAPGE